MRTDAFRCVIILGWTLAAAWGDNPDRIDQMVAAGVVSVKSEKQAGYGLVCSTGALVAVPSALIGEAQKPRFEYNGQTYTPTDVQTDPRGLALCKVPIDGVHTVPLGNADMIAAGATVRVLQPAGPGFRRSECKVVSNDAKRVGRIRIRVLELDLPAQGLALGLPVYLPDNGQVIGLLGVQGELSTALGVQASTVDVIANLVLGAGLQIQPNVLTDQSGVVDSNGRLIDRYVSKWRFEAGSGTVSSSMYRNAEYWMKTYGRSFDQVSQPVSDRGLAYFGDCFGQVYALKLAEQRRSWAASSIGFWITHVPVVGEEMLCVLGGVLEPPCATSYKDLLLQKSMFRQQDALGGPLKAISQSWRKLYAGSFSDSSDPWMLFALYGAGGMVGLERATGHTLWTLPVSYCARPLGADGRVFFGGLGIRGSAALADGKLLWAFGDTYGNVERGRTTNWFPAYVDHNRLLYVALPLHYADDGRQQVAESSPELVMTNPGYSAASQAMWQFFGVWATRERLYEPKNPRLVADGECYLVECDPATGQKRREWELSKLGYDRHNTQRPLAIFTVLDSPGTPTEAFFGLVGRLLFRFEPATGTYTALHTFCQEKDDVAFSPGLAVKDGVVFVGTSKRELLALEGKTGKPVWPQTPVLKSLVGAPLVLGGVVYVGTADGYLHAISAASGQELWWYDLGGKVVGQPVPLQQENKDLLLCGLDSGNFVAIELPGP